MRITEIDHPNHPHPLTLERPKVPFKCQGCLQLGFGACYSCERCNFYFHKECALPSNSLYHPLFSSCDFEFRQKLPCTRVCDACRRDIDGCAYQCTCKGDDPRDLHPCCAKLPHSLAGENGVELKLTRKIPSKCLKCRSKKNTRRGAKGWSYVSKCGSYCFHVACVEEMIYDAWERGYFGSSEKGRSVDESTDSLPEMQVSLPPNGGKEVASSSGVAAKLRMVISVLTVIVSAIFGDPITMFTAVIIGLARSMS